MYSATLAATECPYSCCVYVFVRIYIHMIYIDRYLHTEYVAQTATLAAIITCVT